jgi:ABC-type multidrug transport system ATPase subunit/ABC-type multidrug transport system permease subunit
MSEITRRTSCLLEIEGVSKRFESPGGPVDALCDVSLSLRPGSIVGVFGNNGAGKTTLMRTIAGLIEPTSGRIRIDGTELAGRTRLVQRRLGLCSADERSFYPRLSALENLRLFGQLHGLEERVVLDRIARHAKVFGMESFLHRPFQACSSGQRQRLNLIRGMLHEPDVLMFDEAARSADPATVELLGAVVREYVAAGRLLLYTSHEFQGIEDMCDSIVVLDRGSVVLCGRREEVLSRLVEPAWKLGFRTREGRARAIARHPELVAGSEELVAFHPMGPGEEIPEGVLDLSRALGAELSCIERRTRLSVRELLLALASEPSTRLRLANVSRPADVHSGTIPRERGQRERRPESWSRLRAVRALVRRDRLIYTSHRFKLLLQTSLMLVWAALFFFVSQLVHPSDPLIERWLPGGYFSFALFGLAFLQISQVCLLHMGHALREEQLQGTVEPLVVTGQAPFLLLIASLLWPLAMSVASMTVMVGAGALLFGADLSRADWLAASFAGLLTISALAALGVLSAAFVLAFKRGDPVAIVLNVAALLLGGAYFPVEVLPQWLQRLSQLVPLTHGLRAVRAAVLDGAGLASAECRGPLTSLALLVAILLPLAWVGFRRAVAYARRQGSLCHS